MSLESFQASLVLGIAGNALGSKNEKFGTGKSSDEKQKIIAGLGGLRAITVAPPAWPVPEEGVFAVFTIEALATGKTGEELVRDVAMRYADCMATDMTNKPISTYLLNKVSRLQPSDIDYGIFQDYDDHATHSSAAIRCFSVGLRFHKAKHVRDLIAAAVDISRILHHHPVAYMGGVTAALFTSYAIQKRELREWGAGLMATIPMVLEYVASSGKVVIQNGSIYSMSTYQIFEETWKEYLRRRDIIDGERKPKFPRRYDMKKRNEFYQSLALPDKELGATGLDATLIAYDALLSSGSSWEDLCNNSMFHAGQGNVSGALAASWWGIQHGFSSVPPGNYNSVHFKDRLMIAATKIYDLSW
ncbi:ADP-ribosylhydrolase ARH1-like [Lytechinus pictus]|uniref:ADP-ribosylhydrolase ARH1-like n=1 Tax=Lytechinus pictus TaxID=7653 RepID=UPI0030B9CF15